MSAKRNTVRQVLVAFLFTGVAGLAGCAVLDPPGYEAFEDAIRARNPDAIVIYDTLEALIAEGDDTRTDRKLAFRAVRDLEEDTAEFQFAWAALAGRFVQYKGLLAADLLKSIESHARRSVELDPSFRMGAATRLLGTMYVVAPSIFVEHGDSETGLEMLLGLVERYPDDPENHLRVAEAYVSLGDRVPAAEHLCFCLAVREGMRKDWKTLLDNLVADAGPLNCSPAPTTPAKKSK